MIECKVKGHIIGLMEINMRENGKKVKSMVKGYFIGLMEINMWDPL